MLLTTLDIYHMFDWLNSNKIVSRRKIIRRNDMTRLFLEQNTKWQENKIRMRGGRRGFFSKEWRRVSKKCCRSFRRKSFGFDFGFGFGANRLPRFQLFDQKMILLEFHSTILIQNLGLFDHLEEF